MLNLLKGSEVAAVSDSAVGCTFEHTMYPIPPNYNVFDTAGLSEGSAGTVGADKAIEQLEKLLKQLSLTGGVNLLIFVAKFGRITKTVEDNFNLFVKTICMNRVPVLLFLTNSEWEPNPRKWWEENAQEYRNHGMIFGDSVVGCAANPDKYPAPVKPMIRERRKQSLKELTNLIERHALQSAWRVVDPAAWLGSVVIAVIQILMAVSTFFFPTGSIVTVLGKLGLSSGLITSIVNMFK